MKKIHLNILTVMLICLISSAGAQGWNQGRKAIYSAGIGSAQAIFVPVYDYPGYGTSPGRASEQGTYDAVEAAWNYLTNTLQIPPDRIILHGRSVGSGPAVWLAGRVRPAGLIVESGFVSAFRVMTRIPLLPFDRFPNLKRLPLVTCPMLFIHGAGDPVIKAWHGRALAKAAGDRGTQCIIEGAGHNDVSWVRRKKYWDAIRRFADSLDGRINRSAVLPQAGE